VLLVDEVLSVGDEEFQKKCFARINEFRDKGSTIILVSHSMVQIVNLCQRAALLSKGKLDMVGNPATVIEAYRRSSI
jgi:ABC-type polysaccharide/polyol phosphate transport system ATPase subunit